MRADWALPYSGAPAAALHIAKVLNDDDKIETTGFAAVGFNPYFKRGRMTNFLPPDVGYYHWSTANAHQLLLGHIVERQPPYILYVRKFRQDPRSLTLRNYEEAATFPGYLIWKDRILEEDTFILYQRRTTSTEEHAQ